MKSLLRVGATLARLAIGVALAAGGIGISRPGPARWLGSAVLLGVGIIIVVIVSIVAVRERRDTRAKFRRLRDHLEEQRGPAEER